MAVWSIQYDDAALKSLGRIPANWRTRIRSKLEQLAHDPRALNPQVKPITSRPGVHRLRVGDWRVFYLLKHQQLVVFVIDVAPRGSAYD